MPRTKSHTPHSLADDALAVFWNAGFGATSMDDLVRATGVSRHGIYGDFGGKRALFLACFDRYQDLVVTPAFAAVERPGAGLAEISAYFEHQIGAAEALGLPGPGCFVANAATEVAPHDAGVREKVAQHNDRLRRGFANALRAGAGPAPDDRMIARLAETALVFATGLWSLSRVADTAGGLRQAAADFIAALERMLS
ncbi:TetR/AcrR family transcriptional regulator [Zavarzinia compransoris]|uniref:TetR/AcrR family transcriptional regulator n=1 Tax=Zavarzinia marina TaxID=2911065 RepID=UPI001F2265D0|nr:TetR/AcrR family transcriptional regulator [Zavarzinia marina]MCF4167472.1 TetR/AcrR family transcriptional regulator [Zavarzinia marina]